MEQIHKITDIHGSFDTGNLSLLMFLTIYKQISLTV